MTGWAKISVVFQSLLLFFSLSLSALSLSLSPNFPITIGAVHFSSPLAEDLDGDGYLEIVALSWDDKLHLLSSTGKYLSLGVISTDPVDNFGETSSPSAVDLNGDGRQEVIFVGDEGILYILDLDGGIDDIKKYELGAVVQRSTPAVGLNSQGKWVVACGTYGAGLVVICPQTEESVILASGEVVTSTPALGDINRDGELDVVFGTNDGKILAYSLSHPDLPIFSIATEGPIQSSVALGDIDGDQYLEGLVGSLDGSIYAFNRWGEILPGFPIKLGDGYADEGIVSSPALGDVNNDGFLEIVVATGMHTSTYGRLLVINRKGGIIAQRETDCGIISSPVLANLDQDGQLEILAVTYNGDILAIEADGADVIGYPIKLSANFTSTPTINDIDNDGYQELLLADEGGQLLLYDLNAPHQFSAWNTFHGSSDHDGVTLYVPSPQQFLGLDIGFDGQAVVLDWNAVSGAEEYRVLRSYQDQPQEFTSLISLEEDTLIYRDVELEEWGRYFYKVCAYKDGDELLCSNLCSVSISQSLTPKSHSQITSNYPNPFSASTMIDYIVGEAEMEKELELAVYDITGKKLATLVDELQAPGNYSLEWDGMTDEGVQVASGVYFLRLQNGLDVSSRTLVVVR